MRGFGRAVDGLTAGDLNNARRDDRNRLPVRAIAEPFLERGANAIGCEPIGLSWLGVLGGDVKQRASNPLPASSRDQRCDLSAALVSRVLVTNGGRIANRRPDEAEGRSFRDGVAVPQKHGRRIVARTELAE